MKGTADEETVEEHGENLRIAGLAVVVEMDKIRPVHDGRNGVKVNNRIRAQDQIKSPSAGKLWTPMRERREDANGSRQLVLVGDVSKARGRGCRLEGGTIWVNCVGACGSASAGYWWARLSGAASARFFYYLVASSGRQGALLFSSDLLMMAGRIAEIIDLGAFILAWVTSGGGV